MKNEWRYTQLERSALTVREIEIDSGKGGEPVVIVNIADPHFNAYTENDLKEPALASTIEYRKWQAGGASVPNFEICIDYAKSVSADQVVISGDVLDFLSEGCVKLMKEHIWDKYPDTLVCMGNHDTSKKVQGKVEDTSTIRSKLELLQKVWKHDIRYESRVLKNKVLLIVMDNATEYDFGHKGFFAEQIEPLQADLIRARKNNWKVLIFYHVPISTEDKTKDPVVSSMVGDKNVHTVNFAHIGIASYTDGATGEIYRMIVSNADIIGGCFCGHLHSDFYTEIKAADANGEPDVIPQYVLIGTPYDKGHVIKIVVR